ncbi:RIO1 family regulatory kinase/ATPase domain-containing protein [Priestia filamentosa]|uniref:non-specific serine/threonine protein kinase n=1 Tax=Priestia filamentosa TaxID=1402861 RepID=A0A1X7F310_9BACI|nr:RIO1 family regulatory kinase/ATPase [Priestia filamentosa]AKO91609.1 serine/threonine protein kinase [Priestia filamentosa]MDT3761718.1 RIO1 family regulatory kinase/ATPase [Priestia filamentosa]OXS67812.1 serine/threonine protein kinase [Priestia filamentosa]RJS64987.1 serine/threonine protein kinase [Priestia filamentosa]WCM16815.1 protein kinase family protein [Priestia filamentosa]
MREASELVEEVKFQKKGSSYSLIHLPRELKVIGTGRSAWAFKVKNENKVIKLFFPSFDHLAQKEGEVYEKLSHSLTFPEIYEVGPNYIVMEYIKGKTFYQCLTTGVRIPTKAIEEVEKGLAFARSKGLNPSDIHLHNLILTKDKEVRIIDVVRYTQKKTCYQWRDLARAYRYFYQKSYFPKKFPKWFLEAIAYLYKYCKRLSQYRNNKELK